MQVFFTYEKHQRKDIWIKLEILLTRLREERNIFKIFLLKSSCLISKLFLFLGEFATNIPFSSWSPFVCKFSRQKPTYRLWRPRPEANCPTMYPHITSLSTYPYLNYMYSTCQVSIQVRCNVASMLRGQWNIFFLSFFLTFNISPKWVVSVAAKYGT
jgi:hypothetical protein